MSRTWTRAMAISYTLRRTAKWSVTGRADRSAHASFIWAGMPPHPTFSVRKGVYERQDAFNTGFSIAADYELMLRFLLLHRLKVRYVERVLVRMAIGGNSNRSIGNIARSNLEVIRAWRDNDIPFGFLVPVLKAVQNPIQIVRWPKTLP